MPIPIVVVLKILLYIKYLTTIDYNPLIVQVMYQVKTFSGPSVSNVMIRCFSPFNIESNEYFRGFGC